LVTRAPEDVANNLSLRVRLGHLVDVNDIVSPIDLEVDLLLVITVGFIKQRLLRRLVWRPTVLVSSIILPALVPAIIFVGFIFNAGIAGGGGVGVRGWIPTTVRRERCGVATVHPLR
jgi:hypothetical protein